MSKIIEPIREQIPFDCFRDTELMNLLKGSPNRRYGLIKRALAHKELIHIRRGLYCLAERYRRQPLNLFWLAQQIYGPSYISFESALSQHGWIPEAVHTITSASLKRSRHWDIPLGLFSYTRIPCDPFLTRVVRETEGKIVYLIAKPWKALADMVYAYKKDWRGVRPLMQSLRIDEEFLTQTDPRELEEIQETFRSRRVLKFFKGVRKDLKL
ncbi:MAG: hypothetical protein HY538_05155 [Deltaproteobacteria bacterium]|nr:hypothetical protein [Deltaproteobacteria bacterium]